MTFKIEVDGELKPLSAVTFDEWRHLMGQFFTQHPSSSRMWNVIVCQRGPDHPSERPDQEAMVNASAYALRRARKHKTVEIIRYRSWFGMVGNGARRHDSDHVTLPPKAQWDHFDRHVATAADELGLTVEIKE